MDIRRYENAHIFLWLLKDISWAADFKYFGTFMIIPTLTMAFFILYHTKSSITDCIHNSAVVLWIVANSLWMTGEFFGFDNWSRNAAIIPFLLGIFLIIAYYTYIFVNREK